MDKIQKQGSRIAELIDKGREQGYLTYADVNDHLPEDISDPDQVDEIIGMINDLGLQVHEKAPEKDDMLVNDAESADELAAEEAAAVLVAVENEAGRTTDKTCQRRPYRVQPGAECQNIARRAQGYPDHHLDRPSSLACQSGGGDGRTRHPY